MKHWSASLREEAGMRAKALGPPGPKHDAWRLADLSALYGELSPPSVAVSEPPAIDVQAMAGALRIVFVDGRYSPALSDLPIDAAVKVSPLGPEDPALHEHFGKSMPEEVFAQRNTAHFEDCAWIHVRGEAQKPIHVLFAAGSPASLYARVMVVLEANARATLVEEYAGGEAQYRVNAMTEVVLKEQAALRHVRVQREGARAQHVGNTAAALARGSVYDATSVAFGGRVSRHYIQVSHRGEGAEVKLDGLVLADGRQVMDAHTRIDHLAPRCGSLQREKCIAGGSATAVFSGNIVVHKHAPGTQAKQESRNLLLSEKARILAQPQLEILNDDVSCRHGATVGQLDAEALFYLKSRGLGEDAARKLLVYAFAAEIVERIPLPGLVESLRQSMAGRLA